MAEKGRSRTSPSLTERVPGCWTERRELRYSRGDMAVASLDFAPFVMAALAVFYCLAGRAQVWWLLAVSYFFCTTLGWPVRCLVLSFTGLTQVFKRAIVHRGPRRRRPRDSPCGRLAAQARRQCPSRMVGMGSRYIAIASSSRREDDGVAGLPSVAPYSAPPGRRGPITG